ncbi:hypothetical protein BSLA_02f3545 [Burkholderia stabilis]|nr:hypothetical protein BSLA_02f3545 [Burkholderia stabilis]
MLHSSSKIRRVSRPLIRHRPAARPAPAREHKQHDHAADGEPAIV